MKYKEHNLKYKERSISYVSFFQEIVFFARELLHHKHHRVKNSLSSLDLYEMNTTIHQLKPHQHLQLTLDFHDNQNHQGQSEAGDA
jgi:hypothetical protein